MSFRRIAALLIRHYYLYRRNFPRLFDIIFWPVSEMILWGFMTLYLVRSGTSLPPFVGFLLGALMMWEILFRSNLGITVSHLEEVWTRNALNLFASPLTIGEYVTAGILSSLIRVFLTLIIMVVLGLTFYNFNLFTIGFSFFAFFVNLVIMGWSVGIVTMAILFWFGQSAEILGWASIIFLQPFSAVFYPVSVLPKFVQYIAHAVPASHIFEGLRTLLNTGVFDGREFLWAFLLNVLYLTVALKILFATFRRAKKTGRLVRAWL